MALAFGALMQIPEAIGDSAVEGGKDRQLQAKIYALSDAFGTATKAESNAQHPKSIELTPKGEQYAVELNNFMIDALLIEKADFLDLNIRLNILSMKDAGDASLEFVGLGREIADGFPLDLARPPFLSIPCKSLVKGWNSIALKSPYWEWDVSGQVPLKPVFR
jgi:hypothetical protein